MCGGAGGGLDGAAVGGCPGKFWGAAVCGTACLGTFLGAGCCDAIASSSGGMSREVGAFALDSGAKAGAVGSSTGCAPQDRESASTIGVANERSRAILAFIVKGAG